MLKALLVLSCVRFVTSYPNGAPQGACDSMMPNHRSITAQTGVSPFKISAPVGKCQKDVTVTLSGSTPFLGFLCQARPNKGNAKTSGTFTPLGSASMMKNSCPQMTSLTHSNKDPKTSVQFKWTPTTTGDDNEKTVYIVCTFVQEFDKFWTMQSSLNIVDPSCGNGTASLFASPSASVLALITMLVLSVFKYE